ncbi:hypothetical protein CIB84_000339 [Bambusicola thoracicus]|uniref:TNFR-Cys domain-containing protein n=1 Tax=Bambusicola thoracicus TaxID=9083 RepID=A0A2P4THT5_BAMTH|nr:hypothetical protein CIB84_000339 [Bambusicola thoracicus]
MKRISSFYVVCILGERMRNRCTATADTVCAPCQDNYFSTEHNHSFCRSCTVCDTSKSAVLCFPFSFLLLFLEKGSVEVKKCEKTSDRICQCLPGYMPDTRYALGSVCLLCPEGFYSTGGNESCRPWTNCSAIGKKTLRAGTRSDNAVCSDNMTQPATSESATPTLHLSTNYYRNNTSTAVPSPSKPSVNPFVVSPDANSPTGTNWGSLSLILICLILLMVSGISIFMLIIQAAKRENKRRACRNDHQSKLLFREKKNI